MKTTLNLPDELYRDAKVKAAESGVTVTEVVVAGLRLVLGRQEPTGKRVEFPLIAKRSGSALISAAKVRRAMEEMEQEEDRKRAQPLRR